MGRVSTIGTRYHNPMIDKKQDDTPGPGAYNEKQQHRESPKFSMSKARRKSAMVRRIDRELPGVGIYSPTESATKRKLPQFSMGKKIKLKLKNRQGAESPGPAAYKTSISPKRSISMPRERRPLGNSSAKLYGPNKFNVGPGQYELASIFEKRKYRGMKFSTDVD